MEEPWDWSSAQSWYAVVLSSLRIFVSTRACISGVIDDGLPEPSFLDNELVSLNIVGGLYPN